MRAHRLIPLFLSLGVMAAWAGCGSDDSSGVPTTATTTSGSGGSTSTTTSATTGTTVASTSSGGTDSKLGLDCQEDSDCGDGGRCITPTENDPVIGGGPAGGYCTKDCETDSDCDGGTCLSFDGVSECFLDCEIGPALEFLDDPLDENKCHGREDVRCTPITGAGDVCIPTCGSDQQCPNGRVCDPRFRVCVDSGAENTGDPNGGPCDPNASEPTCAGTCVNFTSGVTMCSNSCVLGGDVDAYDCGGLTEGLCVFRPSDNGPGDYGFCSPACKQHDECNNPDWWCFGIGGVSDGLVDNGFCFGATACPNGNECTGDDVCTDTKYGPFCLDTIYPLGSAAPDPTGSGGGGAGGSGAGGGGMGGSGGSGGGSTSGAGGAGGAGGGAGGS